MSLQALSGGKMPRELFSCIFKPKEKPVKGTPSLHHSHACSRSRASRDQLVLRYFWEHVLSNIFLDISPFMFPLKSIHPRRETSPKPCLPKAHQALRASRSKPATEGSLELLGMTRGAAAASPAFQRVVVSSRIGSDGLIRLPKIFSQAWVWVD